MRRYYVPISLAVLVSILMIAIAFVPDYFVKKDLHRMSVSNDQDSLQLFYYYQHITDRFRIDTAWNENVIHVQYAHQVWLDSLYAKKIVVASGRSQVSVSDPRYFDMAIIQARDIRSATELVAKDPRVIHGTHIAELIPFSLNHIATIKKGQSINNIVL